MDLTETLGVGNIKSAQSLVNLNLGGNSESMANMEDIPNQISKIQQNIGKITEKTEHLAIKISEIKKVIIDLQGRKTLYTNEDPVKELQFQIVLLSNDRNYLSQVKKVFVAKINDDFYELASDLVLLVSTMATLDFKDPNDDNNLIKKIITVKKPSTDNTSSSSGELFKLLNESIKSIVNNLDLIQHFLMEFNAYIKSMKEKVTNEVYHCTGLYPELLFKYQSIYLEYKKFNDMLKTLTDYYTKLSEVSLTQAQTMKISDFCGSNTSSTPSSSPIL